MQRTWVTIAAAALLLLSAFAYPSYRGGTLSFLLFDLSFVAMLLLALPRPRSDAYFFFAIMLFLGFWLKLMLHMLSGTDFLEPVGGFSGKPEAWDRALDAASVGALGVSLARSIQLALGARAGSPEGAAPRPVPSWYAGWRRTIWISSILAALALNVLNLQLAFYQTGVNPRLILPYHLNVPPGWLISVGFALWFAVLVQWESRSNPRRLGWLLLAPVFEGLLSSSAALSRSLYFLHTVPYFFAVATDWARRRALLSRRALLGLVISWAVCFAVSLALVSALRISIYSLAYQPALVTVPGQTEVVSEPTAGATMSNQIKPTFQEVSKLFADRWIGLEGVMAVSSYPGLGYELLSTASRSPNQGNIPLYQVISKSGYEVTGRFNFGSLPGVVGVLFYSGSLAVVGLGMLLVTLLMFGTERTALRFTGNPFFTSIAALGMAHVACQVQYPYLAGVYVAQLWVAIAVVWLFGEGHGLSRRERSPGGAHA